MSNRLSNLPLDSQRAGALDADATLSDETDRRRSSSPQFLRLPDGIGDLLPCVVYECKPSFELTYLSDNIVDLLGLESRVLLGSRSLWDDWVLCEDAGLVLKHFNKLKISDRASVIHRLIDIRGLPLWVANSIRKIRSNGTDLFSGCLTPLGRDSRVLGLDQDVIAKFVHKMGNHFQVLSLAMNSLQKTVSDPAEIKVLQETLDKALELTRSFSDYSQLTTCSLEIDFFDVLRAAVMTRRPLFLEKGVALDEHIQEPVCEVTIMGDPFLLESAIGHVLQNALEATDTGGAVAVYGNLETYNNRLSVVRLRVLDTGCGIKPDDLPTVIFPFVTSKKNHDGLGLSMASRFVEMHGGLLRMKSKDGLGTETEVLLPVSNSDGSPYL